MADNGLTAVASPIWRRRTLAQLASGGGARFFSTSAFLLVARLVGAAAGFLVQLVLARWFSPHDLGTYFTATSLAVIGGVVAAHGYPSIATRFVSRYRRPESARLLHSFVRHAQIATVALSLALAALVALAAQLWPTGPRAAILIAATTIPFVAAFRLYGSLATATRSFKLAYLPDVCLKPVLLLAALGVLVLFQDRLSLTQVMLMLAAATIVLSVAQRVLLERTFPIDLSLFGTRSASNTQRVARKWRREAHAVVLVAVFSQFFPDLSILIATPVLGPAEIGVLGLCLKLAFLIGFFVMLTQNLLTPDLADALGKRGGRQAEAKLAASTSAATAVTFCATLACIFLGDDVLRIFGSDFAAGHIALALLVAAQLVRAAFGPVNAVLTLIGEQRSNLLLAVCSIAVLALSTVLLGSFYGLTGAAAAVLLTMLFWSVTSAVVLYRRAGLRVDLLGTYGRRDHAGATPATVRS